MELIFPNKNIRSKYEVLCREVRIVLDKARHKTGGEYHTNAYYVPYTPEQMAAFRIRKSLVTSMLPTEASIKKMHDRMLDFERLTGKILSSHKKKWTKVAKKK
jgi:hypothetical protein